MGTVIKSASRLTRPPSKESTLPPLEPGDHLDQETFHRRYEAMPEDFRAELIGGIVFMPSPVSRPHGRTHSLVIRWLGAYEDATPGVEVLDNATNILDEESEPQPDSCLFILPEKGGQVRDVGGYVTGAPEWMGEIAYSTDAIDLHLKKGDYERAGVKEYTVVALRQAKVFWFIARRGKFKELALGRDGVFRSEVLPGLWLDPGALLRHDSRRLLAVLRHGLATPEHAAFVAKLAAK